MGSVTLQAPRRAQLRGVAGQEGGLPVASMVAACPSFGSLPLRREREGGREGGKGRIEEGRGKGLVIYQALNRVCSAVHGHLHD